MKRAEIRRVHREQGKNSKIYHMTAAQIQSLKEEATKDAAGQAFVLMMGLPLIVLHDKFGYGRKRLQRFGDELMNQYESFDEGYITLNDLLETIEEETGIKITEMRDLK